MEDKVILWIEDSPETVADIEAYCVDLGFEVIMRSTAAEILDSLKQHGKSIKLIIQDILLYGVRNLKSIRIDNSDTDGGYDAGWVIIEKLLRPEDGDESYAKIPILILSSRPFSGQDIRRLDSIKRSSEAKGLPPIDYYEKSGFGPDGKSWDEAFQEYIEELNSKLK